MSKPTVPTPALPTTMAGLFWPVAAMLGTQTVAVLVFVTVPVMATEMAPAFGVEAKDIGIFLSLVFGSSMLFSAASGSLVRRFGGIRANQIGMTFSACCLLLALSGSLPVLYLAAVLIGIGYAPNTPSGSHVLARVTPAHARGFVFSLKQSGAPIGGVVAGFLVPAMVVNVGWQGAIIVSSMIALCAVFAIQPLRARLDDDRDPSTKITFASPLQAVIKLTKHRALRRLTLVAFFLTSIQAVVMTFLVIILVEKVRLEFTMAGAVFGASQGAGAFTRVAMGWIADRALGARATLIVLGISAAFALVALTVLEPHSPLALVVGLSVLVGALSFGWNGVFLAEVVRLAGPVDVGTAVGGALFFLYGGIVFGPLLMSLLITVSGGFTVPVCGLAGLTVLACLNLLRAQPLPANA